MYKIFWRTLGRFLPTCLLFLNSHAQKIPVVTSAQVQIKVSRYLINDSLVVDSTGFKYDLLGRLTDIIDLRTGLNRSSMSYNGELPNKIRAYDVHKKTTFDVNAAFDLLNQGKTIWMTTMAAGKNRSDTAQLIFDFNGNTLQSRSILVNAGDFSSNYSCLWAYDENGNLTSISQVVGRDTNKVAQVLALDDQKNPLRDMSNYNFILMEKYFPLGEQGIHNVTRYIDSGGKQIDLEITYNENGYPLTYKRKGDNFIADEFIYNK